MGNLIPYTPGVTLANAERPVPLLAPSTLELITNNNVNYYASFPARVETRARVWVIKGAYHATSTTRPSKR